MVSASSPAADPRPAVRIVKERGPAGPAGATPPEELLDEALEMTFPASDPIAVPPSAGPEKSNENKEPEQSEAPADQAQQGARQGRT